MDEIKTEHHLKKIITDIEILSNEEFPLTAKLREMLASPLNFHETEFQFEYNNLNKIKQRLEFFNIFPAFLREVTLRLPNQELNNIRNNMLNDDFAQNHDYILEWLWNFTIIASILPVIKFLVNCFINARD